MLVFCWLLFLFEWSPFLEWSHYKVSLEFVCCLLEFLKKTLTGVYKQYPWSVVHFWHGLCWGSVCHRYQIWGVSIFLSAVNKLPSTFSSHCNCTDSLLPVNTAGKHFIIQYYLPCHSAISKGVQGSPVTLGHTHSCTFWEGHWCIDRRMPNTQGQQGLTFQHSDSSQTRSCHILVMTVF